jgi:hypothetical protein
LDVATLKERAIADLGRDNYPAASFGLAARMTLLEDGRTFVFARARPRVSLWMLSGFDQRRGWLRFFDRP